MKSYSIVLIVLLVCFNGNTLAQSITDRASKITNRAKENDKVLIVVNYVKDDSKQAFDKWIKDVLYSALYKSTNPMKQKQLLFTRFLEPVSKNKDNTWTYTWIMDPELPKTDYYILTFLQKEYGDELGKKHWANFERYLAREAEAHYLNQTGY